MKTFGDKAESHYQRALGILTRPLNTKETEVSRLGDAMTERLVDLFDEKTVSGTRRAS